jgi:hypothetical protein
VPVVSGALSSRHTGRDTVRVKRLLLRELFSLALSGLALLTRVTGGAEAAGTLLVHLGAGRDAVDRHEEDLLGLDFGEEEVDVLEDGEDHLLLGDAEVRVVLGRWGVGAVVDDTILSSAGAQATLGKAGRRTMSRLRLAGSVSATH